MPTAGVGCAEAAPHNCCGFGSRRLATSTSVVEKTCSAVPGLSGLADKADLLLVAGDLTENGRLLEAEVAGELLAAARLPVVAVLGNHDLRSLRRVAFRRVLERRGDRGARRLRHRRSPGERVARWHRRNGRQRWRVLAARGAGRDSHANPEAACHSCPPRVRGARTSAAFAGRGRAHRDASTSLRPRPPSVGSLLASTGCSETASWESSWTGERLISSFTVMLISEHSRVARPGGVPVRNVALPVVGRVHLEVLELEKNVRGHVRAPEPSAARALAVSLHRSAERISATAPQCDLTRPSASTSRKTHTARARPRSRPLRRVRNPI